MNRFLLSLFFIPCTCQLCRLERVSAGSGYHQELFVECPPIFVSENCSPPSDSLMSLINLCGGKVKQTVASLSLERFYDSRISKTT